VRHLPREHRENHFESMSRIHEMGYIGRNEDRLTELGVDYLPPDSRFALAIENLHIGVVWGGVLVKSLSIIRSCYSPDDH